MRADPVWTSSSLQPVHRGIPGRETNPCFHGGGHRAQLLFRSRLQEGRELSENTFRNLFMMNSWLRGVLAWVVRGMRGGQPGTRLESEMASVVGAP